MKKTLKKITLMLLSIFALQVYGLDFVFTNEGWGKGNKYAIEGYDAVAYFADNKAVKGNKKFEYQYQGKKWHFANAKNLDLFKQNAQKYAPQYGGHCAWRMGVDGVGVYGDPNIWTIVDDKLYLNYNKEVNQRWKKDIPGFINKANDFWLGKNQFKTLN